MYRPQVRLRPGIPVLARRATALAGICLTLALRSATVVWDGGGDGTSWTDPLNWSGDVLPGPEDTAVLDVATDPEVTLTGPAVTVAALDCREMLVLAGDGLSVTGAAAIRNQGVRLTSGTLTAGSMTLTDATLEQTGGTLGGTLTLIRGRLALSGGSATDASLILRGAGTASGVLPAGASATLEGSTTHGAARWSIDDSWRIDGTVRMTSISNDSNDRGAYLEVPEGSLLHLGPAGQLTAELGRGDARRLTGAVLNEGSIRAPDVELRIQGRLESRGGRYAGTVRIVGSDLLLTGAPPEATTLDLHGASNRLLTGIPANTVLQINGNTTFGLARLTVPEGVANDGTVRLTCTANDFNDRSAELVVSSGTFTNRPGGRMEVLLGNGDDRRFSGNLRNEGTLEIEADTTLVVRGTVPAFTQAGGTLAAAGAFLLESGAFDYTGGDVTGTVRGRDSRFTVGPGIAGPATLRAVGGAGTFAGNASPAVTLWLEGNTTWGASRLTVDMDAENHGTLLMRSSNGNFNDQSSYLTTSGEATLRNAATGRIRAELGSGDQRRIDGRVTNAGSIEAEGIALEFRGRLESEGGTYAGDVRFLETELLLTGSPPEPTTLFLHGGGNRLLGDIPVRTVLEVRGNTTYGIGLLTLPTGLGNAGIVRLTCTANDFQDRSARMTIGDGAFTNRAGGRIEIAAGAGDARILSGNLVNEGTVWIEEGATLTVTGSGQQVVQADGFLQAEGAYFQEGGSFLLTGGILSGTVRLRNATVATEASATEANVLRVVGFENHLDRHLSPAATLWIEGTVPWGAARLRVPANTTSAGILHLETTSNDFQDRGCYLLVEPDVTLTNSPTGRITTRIGAGDSRNLTGRLWHRGTIEVGDGDALNLYERLDLDGGGVAGDLRLFNTDIASWRPAGVASVLPLYGTGNRLLGDLQAGYTLWIRGTTSWGLARLTAPLGFVNHGTLRLETASNDFQDRSSRLTVTEGVLHNAPDGVIELLPGAGDARQVSTELLNEGLIRVATDSGIGRTGARHALRSGRLAIESGATLTITGNALLHETGAALGGTGTLAVEGVAYTGGGTIAPGASPGLLTIRGNLAATPASDFRLEAAGTDPGSLLDRVAITGTADLDGRIHLQLIDGYAPEIGDRLVPLTFGSVRGMPAGVDLPELPPDRAWLSGFTATTLELSVIAAEAATNRPPVVVVPPNPVTVVKGRTARFAVTVNGTPPFTYQWQHNGEDLPGETGAVLTLDAVRPDQEGTYRVRVANAVDTIDSAEALLTVLPAVGTLIPVDDAVLPALPSIGGDGVVVDVYNGIGGGTAPSVEHLEGLSPSGSTPSPVIDFPHPASTVAVGTRFDTFFADTTTPPASLSAVEATNFLLDHQFLLRVDPADDLHPDTPEIDLDLGVGSDDGFRLAVGSVELGSARDRAFTYSWFTVSFPGPGLYPVRILFAANATGSSGLEFSWRTARAGQQIVPQESLYRDIPQGDRLVTFDDLEADTEVSDQYAPEGVLFRTVAGQPRVSAANPDRLVPVSPPHVLASADPMADAFSVELTFVTPEGGHPASTDFVSLYGIDAEEGGVRIEMFGPAGESLEDLELHGGIATREQVAFGADQITLVRITQLDPADSVAIDHISFAEPVPLNLPPILDPIADIAVDEGDTAVFEAVASDPDDGDSVQLTVRAGIPEGATFDPESGTFRWQTDEVHGPGEFTVIVVATDDGLPPRSTEQEVRIIVREVNLPPELQPTGPWQVSADGPLSFALSAFDPDLPAQPLSFSLGSDAPVGMSVDPVLGIVTWSVDRSVPAGLYTTTVTVDDGQSPAFSATQPLAVLVDHDGPHVLALSPAGTVNNPVTTVELQFDREILLSSITAGDIGITGPDGPVAPSSWQLAAPDRLRIRLPEQRRSGAYQVRVGPGILALNRAPMNQDRDATNGEPLEDAFTGQFTLALPNLVLSEVSGPAEGAPGDTVSLSWRITNTGTAPAVAPWYEAVLLSADDQPGNDIPVTDFRITETLDPGASVVRTFAVTVPFSGAAGDLRWVAAADVNGSVAEESEGDNTAIASGIIHIAPGLTLQSSRTEVDEDDAAFQVSLRRNGGTSADLAVVLAADPAGELDLPATVLLPAGQASVTFLATPVNDGVVDGNRPVILTATAEGYRDGGTTVTVRDIHVPLLRLQLSRESVAEGERLEATVRREPLAPGPLTVRLDSRNAAQLGVPAEVILADGEGEATFEIIPVDDRLVEAPATVDITASAAGHAGAVAPVVVLDNDAPQLLLEIAPAAFSEGAGATAARATLTRRPAGTEALRVAVASSNPGAAVVPATVTFPPGAPSVPFSVGAVDDAAADGPETADLIVSLIDSPTGRIFAEAVRTTVTVTDDDTPALSVVIDRDVVAEGVAPAALVRIRGNQPTDAPVTVTLTSSDPGEAVVPPTLVLASGDQEVVVPLDSVDDGVPDGSQTVTVTAAAAGFTSGSDVVVVSDIQQPDLLIDLLTGPVSGRTLAPFQVTFREVNRGLAPADGEWRQSIFLSSDPYPGDDRLLGTVGFTGTLPPGLFAERTLQFRLPETPGTYWLLAVSDVDNAVGELLEDNNTTVAPVPITVTAAYTAEVATEVVTAPAGVPIPLAGRAVQAGTQVPAPFERVDIHVRRGETLRRIAALTDAEGRFTAEFVPLPGEAGVYTLGAAHPGETQAPVQDSFTLLGMRFEPREASLVLSGAGTAEAGFELRNLSDVPITGLAVEGSGFPDWVTLDLAVPADLPGSGAVTVQCTATVTRDLAAVAEGFVEVRGEGGLLARLALTVGVEPRVPRLVATPVRIAAGMLRGEQTLVTLGLRNEGGAPSGPLSILLPQLPWLSVASEQPLPDLAPGQSADVTLLLSPPADLALGRHEGSLLVSGSATTLAVPFSFLALSSATGTLAVETVDEFTYYAEGSPRVAGAVVSVTDELTGVLAATAVTDATGRAVFPDLREGYYRVAAEAAGHTRAGGVLLVPAGETVERTLFLARNTVEYRWTVTPTEIEDRTRITVEAVFETVVPAPVVVVEPSVIDFAEFTSEVSQIDLKVTNHGLIAAQDLRLNLPQLPNWELEPLVTDLGDLPARSSFTIPVIIRRTTAARAAATAAGGGGGCHAASVLYRLVCGPFDNTYSIRVGLHNDGSGCPVAGGVITPVGAAGGPGGGHFTAPRAVAFDSKCGPGPCAAEIAKWSFDCAFSILPFPDPLKCGKGVYDCLSSAASGGLTGSTGLTCVGTALDCAAAAGKAINPIVGAGIGLAQCLDGMRSVAECLEKAAQEQAGGGARLASWDYEIPADLIRRFEVLEERLRALSDHLVIYTVFVGNDAWFHPGIDESFGDWFAAVQAATGPDTPLGHRIDLDERAALLAGPRPTGVGESDLHRFIDRWNRTADYYAQGILNRDDLPPGSNPDFIAFDELLAAAGQVNAAVLATEAAGFDDPVLALQQAARDWQSAIEASGLLRFTAGAVGSVGTAGRAAIAATPEPRDPGICARVRLRIDQEAVITRDAFAATLEIDNRQDIPLRQIRVNLQVRDLDGSLANDRFVLRQPVVTGFGAVDGTGELAPDSTGTATWTLIPTSDAAPGGPATYTVSGTLEYVDEGLAVTIPLAPASIEVLPNARLAVKYFHQRDVLADDPFTGDIVEPSIPYSLGVLVENLGLGTARNVRIASAQPRIIENEKGLLVDFRIIATEVDGRGLSPALTADLGDIGPGRIAIGRWLLKSSLQGQFIEYAATFEHLDGLGDPRLSLIEGVEIHELIRIVDAGDADPRWDFLANDLEDDLFVPDTLHLSGGGIEPVAPVTDGTVDSVPSTDRLEVALTASFPAGWGYLRMPDPSGGTLPLASIRRADGSVVPESNFWVTDRTFIAGGRRPVYESVLHLLDRDGAGPYVLVYAPPPVADNLPPESRLADLPTESSPRIPLSWSGADEAGGSGVDVFDIFVATDRGPFEPWLQRTRATAATYVGEIGHTYAFYSVATDLAGNREAEPASADAFTSVTRTNRPPTLATPEPVRVNEGETVRVDLVASDPDQPTDRLTFRLGDGAPAGVQLNPLTGRLTWNTSEAIGPATVTIPVEVTDDGLPPLAAAVALEVEITEVNAAPELDPIPDARVGEGEVLAMTLRAQDRDLPANTLRFRFLGEPPAGITLDPLTGTLRWIPDAAQGGVEYVLGVEVTDNGVPALTASRYFTVVVDDILPDFTLEAGRGWSPAGEVARSPLTLDSGQPLTEVEFELERLGDPVPEPELEVVDPEVIGSAFQSLGNGRFRVILNADPARPFTGRRTLANLVFPPMEPPASAMVRLRLGELRATRPSNPDPIHGVAVNGYLVRLAEAPVLLAELRNGQRILRLFSEPGRPCDLEQRDALGDGTGWQPLRTVVPTQTETVIDDLEPAGFVRAVCGREPAPEVRIRRTADGSLELHLERPTTGVWMLQSAGTLGTGAWETVTALPEGDGTWVWPVQPSGEPRWYRLLREPAP